MFKVLEEIFGPPKDTKSLQNEMIAHLEKKYGEKFLPIIIEPSGVNIDYDKLRFYKEGTDTETDRAAAYRIKKDGRYVYHDDYFGIIIREEYESMVKKAATEVFGECKIFTKFKADYFSDDLGKGDNYKDAVENNQFINSSIYIYFEEFNEEEILKSLERLEVIFKGIDIKCTLKLYNLKAGNIDKIDRKNYRNYVKKYTPQYDEVCIDSIEKRITFDAK